jgi:hypothetical protein
VVPPGSLNPSRIPVLASDGAGLVAAFAARGAAWDAPDIDPGNALSSGPVPAHASAGRTARDSAAPRRHVELFPYGPPGAGMEDVDDHEM